MYPYYDDYIYQDYRYNPEQSPMMMPGQRLNRNPLSKVTSNFNFQRALQTTTKTVSTINQITPIIYQVTPIINNVRNAYRIIRAINSIDSDDLSIIDDALKDVNIENVNDKKTQITFENML